MIFRSLFFFRVLLSWGIFCGMKASCQNIPQLRVHCLRAFLPPRCTVYFCQGLTHLYLTGMSSTRRKWERTVALSPSLTCLAFALVCLSLALNQPNLALPFSPCLAPHTLGPRCLGGRQCSYVCPEALNRFHQSPRVSASWSLNMNCVCRVMLRSRTILLSVSLRDVWTWKIYDWSSE